MDKLDNFVSIKPSLELQKHVDSYYFHSCDNSDNVLKYTYYPHIKHAVTIYLDSKAETRENITVVQPETSCTSILYSKVTENPHHVEINGSFKKIGIVFKPYGLNNFIDLPINKISTKTISDFIAWSPSFKLLIKKVWDVENIEERRLLLDGFLKNRKTDNTNHLFEKIIDDIMNSETIRTISNLSEEYDLGRKKLYRMFMRELGCSPSKFLKIKRFRKSLEIYLKTQNINLSNAAVTQFFDQSHFIKNTKQITGTIPKKLTREMSDLENSIFWKLN